MSFENEVKQKLNASQYEGLTGILAISQHRLTKILGNPAFMDVEELKKLSLLMNVDFDYLIDTYNCGRETITIGQYMQLRQEKIARELKANKDEN